MPNRKLSGVVYANGQLEAPPQHEATVTVILGVNIQSIKVIEGDQVRKGQTLAYLAHPDLSNLQASYLKAYNQSLYLEKEYKRQKRLYEEEVGSGKQFQEVESKYQSVKAEMMAYESQLKQLSLSVTNIRERKIYDQISIVSPIDGYIEKCVDSNWTICFSVNYIF